LRDLDVINKGLKSTHSLFLISMILPVATGAACWAMSNKIGGENSENNLAFSGLIISLVALVAIPMSYLIRWDWRSYYYGASLFGVASMALIGLYPVLAIVIYSSLPLYIRIFLLFLEAAVVTMWCHRFVRCYAEISKKKILFDGVYVEEDERFYLLIKRDKKVVETEMQISVFPSGKCFLICFFAGIATFSYAVEITKFLGISFTSLLFAAITAPFPAAFLGLATKMWLMFFLYPSRLRATTGKLIYVDMLSKN
jgi:hypothetical protein